MTQRRRADGTRQILPGVLLLVAGVLIALGAPGIWSLTHQDPALQPIDSGVAVRLAQAAPSGLAAPSSVVSPPAVVSIPPNGAQTSVPTVRTPVPATARRTSTASPAPRIGVPARLRIPAIGVDAPVEAVGVDSRGEMAIPTLVQQIGWYKFGPAPGGSSGSIVMSGHIDSAAQGLGAFHDLGDLTAGDEILVSDAAGHQLRYRVVGKEAFDKKTVPLRALFSRTGAARLTLITCGGAFDAQAHSYLDNIVVTAVPA